MPLDEFSRGIDVKVSADEMMLLKAWRDEPGLNAEFRFVRQEGVLVAGQITRKLPRLRGKLQEATELT